MLKIGIVGAENSHSLAIARTLNVEKAVSGVRVVAIWGETREFAEKAAEGGKIPRIVKRPADLIGLADAAVVDHRNGKLHLPAARPLLRARMPLFIDKPFCTNVAEGRRFLAEAARLKVPVTSFGVVPLQKSFAEVRREVAALGAPLTITTSGPADLFSPYGGVFFYGVHQADMLVRLAGLEATHAQVNASGAGGTGTATVWFKGGMTATMNLLAKNCPGFHVLAVGEKGIVSRKIENDKNAYLAGIRSFVKTFRGGGALYSPREILAPIAILQALGKSLQTGRREKLPAF